MPLTAGRPIGVSGAEDPRRPQLPVGAPHHAGGDVAVLVRLAAGAGWRRGRRRLLLFRRQIDWLAAAGAAAVVVALVGGHW